MNFTGTLVKSLRSCRCKFRLEAVGKAFDDITTADIDWASFGLSKFAELKLFEAKELDESVEDAQIEHKSNWVESA